MSPCRRRRRRSVGHLSAGHGGGLAAQQGREDVAQVAVGEAVGQQTEDQERGEQRVDAGVGETQSGDPLPAAGGEGVVDGGEGGVSGGGVVADSLDAE